MAFWRALTVTAQGGLLRVLETPCHICLGFDPSAPPAVVQLQPFVAIWDTGATNSMITQEVVDACGLKPTGMVQVHGIHGTELAETYLVNIKLPNDVQIHAVPVSKGKLVGTARVLIGMDIIALGDFSITNTNGVTVFSFRLPSQRHIDYVKEATALNLKHQHPAHRGTHKKRVKTPGNLKASIENSRAAACFSYFPEWSHALAATPPARGLHELT